MKPLLIIAIFTLVSCNVTNKRTLDQHQLFSEFLFDFEELLEQRYGQQHENDLFRMFIIESNEVYPTGICLDNINNLFKYLLIDSLWMPVEKNGDVMFFLNFDGWFCDFMDELTDIEPWMAIYRDTVCPAKDISPTSIVLVLEHAENSDLKNEKIRFFIAVHFFSIMVERGCLDNYPLIPH
ncbi:MAG: hypothetical protein K0B37_15390 [Bacteroidales bacterium]|nr:hypothetical protein [Bacteroidales bacterium]